jgi:large subunit ribosomal protein L25
MEQVILAASNNRDTGTRTSRRLRHAGAVPAVIYGLGADPEPVSVRWSDLRRSLTTEAGANVVIELDIEGAKQLAIVKDIQRHPVRRDVIHVDFMRVSPDREVEISIPIGLTGTAEKVAAKRGTVDQAMFELRAFARPADIPVRIQVDVTAMEVGTVIKVDDLELPSGVRTMVDPEESVVVGVATRATLEMERAAKLTTQGPGSDGEPAEGI